MGTKSEGHHTDLEQARAGFPEKVRSKLKAQ